MAKRYTQPHPRKTAAACHIGESLGIPTGMNQPAGRYAPLVRHLGVAIDCHYHVIALTPSLTCVVDCIVQRFFGDCVRDGERSIRTL